MLFVNAYFVSEVEVGLMTPTILFGLMSIQGLTQEHGDLSFDLKMILREQDLQRRPQPTSFPDGKTLLVKFP